MDRLEVLARWQQAGVGPEWLRKVERLLGAVEAWWPDRHRRRRASWGLPHRMLERLLDPHGDTVVAAAWERLQELGYRALDAARVPGVRHLPNPPHLLFVRGTLPEGTGDVLTVVGSRHPTGYGRRHAQALARAVASEAIWVVSGLARGIDGHAHEGALEAGGRTLAVLGAGPDRVYPPEHRALLHRIEEAGGVVTEHLPGTPPRKHHFPRRNRIMVALARALLVIEARVKSGTLTSVRWASDLGRDVLVLPGPVDSKLSEGPTQLRREGATPVGCAAHVLEVFGRIAAENAPPEPSRVGAEEGRLLALLEGGALDLDTIVRLAGESPGRTLTLLLEMELRGLVARDASMRFVLVRPE